MKTLFVGFDLAPDVQTVIGGVQPNIAVRACGECGMRLTVGGVAKMLCDACGISFKEMLGTLTTLTTLSF